MSNPLDTPNPALEFYAISDPAAGTSFAIQPPNNTRGKLALLRFLFSADANPANRIITLKWSDGANSIQIHPYSAVITASQTATVVCTSVPPFETTGAPNQQWLPVSDMLYWISNRHTLLVSAENLQVGDQFYTIRALWNCWTHNDGT